LIVLYVANKIRKKISGNSGGGGYRLESSGNEKDEWSLNESKYWNKLSLAYRIQICEDLEIKTKNAKKNLEKIRGDDKAKIIQKVSQMMSSGEIRDINKQYTQWGNEFQNKYNKLEKEKNYYKDKLNNILAGGASGNEEIEKLRQKIQDLEREINDRNFEKKSYDTKDKKKTFYEILDVPLGVTEEQGKKAHRRLVMFWHSDNFSFNPDRKKYADEQTAIVNNAWDELREKKGWRKSGGHWKSE
jgi:hypothetical protein